MNIDRSRLSKLPEALRTRAEAGFPVLEKCITLIEEDLSLEYPRVILSPYLYSRKTEEGGLFFGWAMTNAFQVQENPPAAEYFIVVSVPMMIYFSEDCIVGILAEEFLHYTFNITKHLKKEHIPVGLAHERAMQPPDLWFTSTHIRKCFERVQERLELKRCLKIVRDWKKNGGRLSDGSDLPNLRGVIDTIFVPPNIAKAITKRGLGK